MNAVFIGQDIGAGDDFSHEVEFVVLTDGTIFVQDMRSWRRTIDLGPEEFQQVAPK